MRQEIRWGQTALSQENETHPILSLGHLVGKEKERGFHFCALFLYTILATPLNGRYQDCAYPLQLIMTVLLSMLIAMVM